MGIDALIQTFSTSRLTDSQICLVFGSSCHLHNNMLPTYEDVMKYYGSVNNSLKLHAGGKEPRVADICESVTRDVEKVWIRASIPIVSHTRVVKLLRCYHDKYMKLLKPYKARQKQETYKKQLKDFKTHAKNTLFDIASCKCEDDNNCKCERTRRVPTDEKAFLRDQRTIHIMCMSNVDRNASEKLSKKQKRYEAQQKRELKYANSSKLKVVLGANKKYHF